jgi:hypothetical protein
MRRKVRYTQARDIVYLSRNWSLRDIDPRAGVAGVVVESCSSRRPAGGWSAIWKSDRIPVAAGGLIVALIAAPPGHAGSLRDSRGS